MGRGARGGRYLLVLMVGGRIACVTARTRFGDKVLVVAPVRVYGTCAVPVVFDDGQKKKTLMLLPLPLPLRLRQKQLEHLLTQKLAMFMLLKMTVLKHYYL